MLKQIPQSWRTNKRCALSEHLVEIFLPFNYPNYNITLTLECYLIFKYRWVKHGFEVVIYTFIDYFWASFGSRKWFLTKHQIALYDVIEECEIENSSDASIRKAKPIDIKHILNTYPNIRKIGITGKKASHLFEKHLKQYVEDVEVVYLPSTSPANAKMSVDELIDAYKVLFVV